MRKDGPSASEGAASSPALELSKELWYLEHKSSVLLKTFSPITSLPGCQNHAALALPQEGAASADLEWNSWKFWKRNVWAVQS